MVFNGQCSIDKYNIIDDFVDDAGYIHWVDCDGELKKSNFVVPEWKNISIDNFGDIIDNIINEKNIASINKTTLFLSIANEISNIMQIRCPDIEIEKIDIMAAAVSNFIFKFLENGKIS